MTRAWVLALLALAACPGKQYGEPLGTPRKSLVSAAFVDAGADAAVTRSRLTPIVTLTERAVGPYLAWSGTGGLVAYVGGKSGARSVMVVALGPTGEPRGAPRRVADVPTDASSLVLRRSDVGGARYYVAWTSLSEKGESLSMVTVAEDGIPAGGAVTLGQTTEDIVWVDVVPTDRGAVCVWAEQTRGGDANLLASGIDASGRPRSVPGAIARGVIGWQATRTGSGVGVGVLRASHPKTDPKAPQLGALAWLRLDPEGRAIGAPVTVVASEVVGGDFDVARMPASSGDSFLFGWTDRTGADPEVALAALDAQGKLSDVSHVDARRGGRALIGLSSGQDGAFVVWEDARQRELPTKRVYSAHVPSGSTSPDQRGPALELRASGTPETRPTHDGLAWLATAGTPVRPVFLRLGGKLAVDQVEPVDDAATPGAAWSLDCAGDRCAALSATGDAETHVSFADLSPRPSPVLPPLAAPVPAALKALTTLAVGATISDVASVPGLVASLSHEDTKGDDTLQTLTLRSIEGDTVGKPEVLSKRALATGAVAMVEADGGAVVAWVDASDAQVHAAKVDPHAKRMKEARVTTGKSAKSDVSIVRVTGGFVVGWVDARDGNGEVYAARLGADVERSGPEQRITKAPGDATDVSLAVAGDRVVCVWADPRESPSDGFADIYAVALTAKDAKPVAPEARILATAAHSRSPSIATSEGGATVVWIEEAPANATSGSDSYGAMIVKLDSAAKPVATPARLHLPAEGVATSIALDPSGKGLRGVVAQSTAVEVFLSIFTLPPSMSPVSATFVVGLDGPPSLDAPLALAGKDLIFGDDGPDAGDARLRHATVDF